MARVFKSHTSKSLELDVPGIWVSYFQIHTVSQFVMTHPSNQDKVTMDGKLAFNSGHGKPSVPGP